MEYYYTDHSGQPVGPISQEQLQALLLNGTINENTLVAPVGAAEWQPLGSLFNIQRPAVPVAPRPQGVPNPRPRAPMHSGAANPRSLSAPPNTVGIFASISPWAYVTSIYWWTSALLLLGLAGFLVYIALKIPLELMPPELRSIRNYFLIGGIILLVPTTLCALPAIQCWSLGGMLSSLRSSPGHLENASQQQASYFKTFSIYLILMAVVILGAFLFVKTQSRSEATAPGMNSSATSQTSSSLAS